MEKFTNKKSEFQGYRSLSILSNYLLEANKKYISEKQVREENLLTIRHFLSVRFVVKRIDFQKLYDDQIEEDKLHECDLKQNEPTIEFVIKNIIKNILDICKENQFVLGILNGQPHYFNNYYYVEINEVLLKNLLSDISKRNGVKNNEDCLFINDLYWSLIKELIPFPSKLKSYKERGVKLTKIPKRIINQEDCYFKNKSYKKPSII